MVNKLRDRILLEFGIFRLLLVILALLFTSTICSASEWRTVELPARALNIVENHGALWVCGADELISVSEDGANTWTTKHVAKNGSLLLIVGFSGEQFGYAAGTGGRMLVTRDGGSTWDSIAVPSEVVYEASFSDEEHGIIHAQRGIYDTNDGGATWVPVPIDFSDGDLKGFSHVLSVVALDAKHLAIVLSEGNSSANDYRLLLTEDGGATWGVSSVPSTGLRKLSAHNGEYWFAGMEVIEKDKRGGGYGVPLVMHSPDGGAMDSSAKMGKKRILPVQQTRMPVLGRCRRTASAGKSCWLLDFCAREDCYFEVGSGEGSDLCCGNRLKLLDGDGNTNHASVFQKFGIHCTSGFRSPS